VDEYQLNLFQARFVITANPLSSRNGFCFLIDSIKLLPYCCFRVISDQVRDLVLEGIEYYQKDGLFFFPILFKKYFFRKNNNVFYLVFNELIFNF